MNTLDNQVEVNVTTYDFENIVKKIYIDKASP